MFKITKEIHFCYGHRLLDYDGPCMHPHGHNATVEIDLAATRLDKRYMVHDFRDLKRTVKGWIDENLDHKMLLRRDDPLVAVLQGLGEPIYIMDKNPTAEAIAEEIFNFATGCGLPVSEVRVWEGTSSHASYTRTS